MCWRASRSPIFPYTTLFRSEGRGRVIELEQPLDHLVLVQRLIRLLVLAVELRQREARALVLGALQRVLIRRSEDHTSELQSHVNLVCRLLLEKKKRTDQLSL